MSRKQTSKQNQIGIFGEIAKGCKTDHQKIEFFDSSKEAFFTDSNESTISANEKIPKDLDDGFYVYANMKKLSETELDELKSLNWNEYPDNFKIFLFDFCILNGAVYSKYFLDYKKA
tara:strand:+ start:75 stop:425 length:351 start_codon:yes stop_codon:yes gene_type:complete